MKYTKDEFIKKCEIIHSDLYDYSLVDYSYAKNKVKIICNKHGVFEQRAQAHIMGQGCKKCYVESRNPSLKELLKEFNVVHKDTYTYDNIGFISMKKKINITCKKHGEFKQIPFKHLKGQGCALCANENHRITKENFIERSNLIHKNLYDYSLVEYINHSSKITIICKKHGKFRQTPNNHLIHKKGCSRCSKIISKMETEWLDSLNLNLIRQHNIYINDRKYIVDAYDEITNTIYEFYGDFWHGNINIYKSEDYNSVNKKKFGDLNNEVLTRENIFRFNGFNVFSIWESDFKKQKQKQKYEY